MRIYIIHIDMDICISFCAWSWDELVLFLASASCGEQASINSAIASISCTRDSKYEKERAREKEKENLTQGYRGREKFRRSFGPIPRVFHFFKPSLVPFFLSYSSSFRCQMYCLLKITKKDRIPYHPSDSVS